MLEDLDAIDWGALTHAYGQADNVPDLIRGLTSADPEVWVGALSGLYDTLCHQASTIYDATPPAVPFLIELLGHRTVRCRGKLLRFLGDTALATSFLAAHEHLSYYARQRDTEEFRRNLAEEMSWVRRTREAIWDGLDVYLDLLGDLDRRLRLNAPYALGLLAAHAGDEMPDDVRRRDPYRLVAEAMARQFEEEPGELVRASLAFGLGCLAPHRPEAAALLERTAADPAVSRPVRVAAAYCLAGLPAELPPAALDILLAALADRDATDHLFDSDQPGMEDKHHPLAKGYRQAGMPLGEQSGTGYDPDDVGKDEDFQFPWFHGWPTVRTLERLVGRGPAYVDRLLPVVLPYLDRATSHTGEGVARPALRLVFGDRKVTPAMTRADLTPAQAEVLRHLYDNPLLWAAMLANVGMAFMAFGLPDRRTDWARLLDIEEKPPTDAEIEALLARIAPHQQFFGKGPTVRRLNLRQIGTPAFLPHLRQFPELVDLDLSGIPLTDADLAPLLDLPKLKRLEMGGSHITDAGARLLAELRNLGELNVSLSRITDAGLEALQRLENLFSLYLYKVPVSDEAVRRFEAARPGCRVHR
jgi:hypothetical protein